MTQPSALPFPVPPEIRATQGADGLVVEHIEQPIAPESAEAETIKLSWRKRMTHILSGAVIAAEVSPANELIRGAMTLGVAGVSHSPIASAIAFGGSTLLVEGAAAVAAAPLLDTNTASKGITSARQFMERHFSRREDDKFSKTTYATAALIGGSAVSMVMKKYDSPNITKKELRSHGIRTALGLSAVLGTLGLAGPKLVELATDNLITTGAVLAVGSGVAAVRNIQKSSIESKRNPVEQWADRDKHGLKYGITDDSIEREKAAILEQAVWDENDYGNLEQEGYTEYFPESRVIVAFEGEECVGMSRIFRNTEKQPPFIKDMSFYDESKKEELATLYSNGELEELALAAVAVNHRGKGANTRLWRLAYRDARERGIKYWGIIMEPERVQHMNDKHGFTFEQLGDVKEYQGGDCAAHVMDLEEVDKHMHDKKFITHFWFTKLKLRASDK